jgi:hypothetical protein
MAYPPYLLSLGCFFHDFYLAVIVANLIMLAVFQGTSEWEFFYAADKIQPATVSSTSF